MFIARKYRKAILFTLLTYASSYTLVPLYFALGGTWTMPGAMILCVGYMFVPMTAALIVQKGIYREPVRGPFRVHLRMNRWFLVSWLLPLVLALGTIPVSLSFPDVSFTTGIESVLERFQSVASPEQIAQMRRQAESLPVHPFWLALVQGLVAGITINALVAFGEELGWRGLLQVELAGLGFWRAAWIIGLLWGFWHAPLILQGHNYPQHPWTGVFMMTAFTTLLSPLLGYVTWRADSVIAAAVFHGSLNATAGLALIPLRGGSDLTIGVTGMAGLATLLLMNVALWLVRRRAVSA